MWVWIPHLQSEIVETTLVVSQFHFLRVESRISELPVIILPEMQILKVSSRICDLSLFRFSYLNFLIVPSHVKRLGINKSLLVLCILNMCLLCIIKSVRVLSSSEKHQTSFITTEQLYWGLNATKRGIQIPTVTRFAFWLSIKGI